MVGRGDELVPQAQSAPNRQIGSAATLPLSLTRAGARPAAGPEAFMETKESFDRGPVVGREPRLLDAALYNKSHLLLVHAERDYLFLPLRRIQYLAVMDREEVIFIDGYGDRRIELAWRHFRPQARNALTETVPYTVEIYRPRGFDTIKHLQADFFEAIHHLDQRERESRRGGKAKVQPLPLRH